LCSILENTYLDECIVDKSLPPQEAGNYLDCTEEEYASEGKEDCCTIDGEVGCCNKGGRSVARTTL